MKKPARQRRGQFVIIAVMLVAIMIISIGALLHNAATYYKHEPWEEYSTLISDIEVNTRHILELSLVNYTNTNNVYALNNSLNQWTLDLSKLYPEKSINLSFSLAQGSRTIYGESLNFDKGLAKEWNKSVSSSAARADFTLNIDSIGLRGYTFTAETLLRVQIVSNSSSQKTVAFVVYKDNNVTIPDLPKTSFTVNGLKGNVSSGYSPNFGAIVYTIYYTGIEPPTIEVRDQRAIMVTANP